MAAKYAATSVIAMLKKPKIMIKMPKVLVLINAPVFDNQLNFGIGCSRSKTAVMVLYS
jgi:predicted Zn-dependent protease